MPPIDAAEEPLSRRVEAWVSATGERCACAWQPPAQRKRGRPPSLRVGKCRSCWRSFATDRTLPPPHDLSLLSRCVHDLRVEDPGLDAALVRDALMAALVAAGFDVEISMATFPLRDGKVTRVIRAQTVWGWRDRRGHHDIFVMQSEVPCSGGGAFAAKAIPKESWICDIKGEPVAAERVRSDPELQAAYVIRVGPRYVDCRDPGGRLRLGDGSLAEPHAFRHADWEAMRASGTVGVAWEGAADLSRFIQQAPVDTKTNVVLRGTGAFSTEDIAAGAELYTDYGADYWGERLADVVQCCVCLESEVYKAKVVRCGRCLAYTHRGCLEAHVDSNALAARRYRAPHKRVGDVLPSCAMCSSPWPLELTGRKQCETPGCTLPMHHTCPHTPETGGLRTRRSETRGGRA